jgi:hypothetical protein
VRRSDEKKFDVQCAIENLESQKREAAKRENYAEAERLKSEINQLRDTLAACGLDIARKAVNQPASLLSWSVFAKLRRGGHLHLGRCFSVGSAQQVLTDDNANKLFGFVILCGKERHAFWATSMDERDGWVKDIQNVIGERMDTVPSKSTSGWMEYVHTFSELSNEEIKSFVHGLSKFSVCICLVFLCVSICVCLKFCCACLEMYAWWNDIEKHASSFRLSHTNRRDGAGSQP